MITLNMNALNKPIKRGYQSGFLKFILLAYIICIKEEVSR
jgi:hypothetical protein